MTNLRAVRVRLTLVFALVSALSVAVLAFFTVTLGVRQIDGQAERDLQEDVAFIVGNFDPADPPTEDDANALRREVALISIAVALFTSLAGWFLSGRSLRPARRALEQQRDFMANAAHELRTPIAVIQASASQALRRRRDEPDYVRALSEIKDASVRAGTSISDMLDLARLEAGQATPRRRPSAGDRRCRRLPAPSGDRERRPERDAARS